MTPNPWADQWSSWARRFNPNHLPAGTGGGEFASAGSGGGGTAGKTAKAHAAHVAHAGRLMHEASSPAARKKALRATAKADRAKAHELQRQLSTLVAQEAKAMEAARKAAAAAKHHHATPKKAVAAHHKASITHRHHVTLKARIASLRSEIHTLLAAAAQADAQAARL